MWNPVVGEKKYRGGIPGEVMLEMGVKAEQKFAKRVKGTLRGKNHLCKGKETGNSTSHFSNTLSSARVEQRTWWKQQVRATL